MQIGRRPLATADRGAATLHLHDRRVAPFGGANRLSFPESVNVPNAGGARHRDTEADRRAVIPPAPARAPQFAVSGRCSRRNSQLAIDERVREGPRQSGCTGAPKRLLVHAHLYLCHPIRERQIGKARARSARQSLEAATRTAQRRLGEQRAGREVEQTRHDVIAGSLQAIDAGHIDARLLHVIPGGESGVGIAAYKARRSEQLPSVGVAWL